MGWVWGRKRWDGVASRIKEGKNEVTNINLFVPNTRNPGPAAIIHQFILLTPEILLFRGGPPLVLMDSAYLKSGGPNLDPNTNKNSGPFAFRHPVLLDGESHSFVMSLTFSHFVLGLPDRFPGSGWPLAHWKPIKKGGERNPPCWLTSGAQGAPQTPEMDDYRPAQKSCIKNPSVLVRYSADAHNIAGIRCLTFRLIFYLLAEIWPTRESFGMARGPRVWALGVDSGPRGRACDVILDPPPTLISKNVFFVLVPKGRLRNIAGIRLLNSVHIGPVRPTLRLLGFFAQVSRFGSHVAVLWEGF